MGSYDFTCATTGDISTVEYTFGYKRCADGKPRIFLHHSSVPYDTYVPGKEFIEIPDQKNLLIGLVTGFGVASAFVH